MNLNKEQFIFVHEGELEKPMLLELVVMFSDDCCHDSRGDGIPDRVKKQVEETMPHYGHIGVIQAARELSKQLDNLAEDDSDEQAIRDCPTDKELGGMCFW